MALRSNRLALRIAGFAMLALFALGAVAALPAGVTQGASIEGITEYTLANGLRVLLFPDATKPTATVNVTYLVGSRQESYGETGMAHLLEHLMFKGTPTTASIFQELGRRGMRFNGSTSFDRTNYFETFTASDENLDWALAMEADRMVNAFIAKKDLDTEMTVVRNEFESGENNPQQVLWGRIQAAAYDWHNYGHVTIGARSDIENVDIGRLQAFYRRYYQPDNAVLIVAGRFDPERTLGRIAKVFGPIPRPTRTLPALYTEEPVQDGERTVTVRRAGGTQFVAAAYHTVRGAHPDAVAVTALGEMMTVEPAGRLYKALVDTKKASAVEVLTLGLADPGDIIFWAQVPLGDSIEAARDALVATVEGIRANPVTDAEVDRVRAKALRSIDETFHDPQRLGVAISESIALGDWRLFFLRRDRWRKVSAADVQRVALAYLKPSNRTVGLFIPDAKPDRAPAPAPVDIAAMVKDYKGDASVSAGETFDPTPANLEARTQRFTLPNGMKVALLPKKTRGETVQFQLSLHFGDETSLKGTSPRGSLAASMLALGTAKRDRQGFEDTLDQLRAKLAIGGGESETIGARRDRAPSSARPAAPRRGGAARAGLSGRRIREAEARACRESRRAAHGSGEHRRACARALEQPVSQRRRPLRADLRRGAGRGRRSHARPGEGLLRALRRRRPRGARGRRRFRPGSDARARHRIVRRVDEPGPVHARAQSVSAAGAHRAHRDDAGQGERHAVRAPAAAAQRPEPGPAGADGGRQDPRRIAGIAHSGPRPRARGPELRDPDLARRVGASRRTRR